VAAFATLLEKTKVQIGVVSGHDSLSAASYHTGQSPARAPETDDEKVSEAYERFSFDDARRALMKLIARDEEGYDYTKHVRSVYCKLRMDSPAPETNDDRVESLDFVFIPEVDLAKYASICDWMQYNFDLQICANAITAKSLYCLAPHEIISRVGFMRLDQYCVNIEPDDEYEEDCFECTSPKEVALSLMAELLGKKNEADEKAKSNRWWRRTQPVVKPKSELKLFFVVHPESDVARTPAHRWNNVKRCECACIIYNRIRKYNMRGFDIIYGTQSEYQFFERMEWRKEIVNEVEEESSEKEL
jgi:hypothetical protein